MIIGDRCTRACGFCLVDTRKPLALDLDEPQRVADAVATLDLAHAVITCVARDDLPDGGASVFAATVDAIRATSPGTAVELLISDCKGDRGRVANDLRCAPRRVEPQSRNGCAAATAGAAVGRVRPFARRCLARAKNAGLVTKSGLILGMGETVDEVRAAMADLRAVGRRHPDARPVSAACRRSHLPVAKWWHPDEFAAVAGIRRDVRVRARRSRTVGALQLSRPRGADRLVRAA